MTRRTKLFVMSFVANVFFQTIAYGEACSKDIAYIEVNTLTSELKLCNKKLVEKGFSISVGRNGTGKRNQADGKTPIGEYGLGVTRPSSKFYKFIPVGYPTADQIKNGFTGGDIGIHGPARNYSWLGSRLNTWINWTQGCIAVGSDSEISEIAEWVTTNHSKIVVVK